MTEKQKAYLEAVQRESVIRETAFLGLPEKVGGFDLRPLSIKDFLTLSAVGSPFVVGGRIPLPGDAAVFLWHQSAEYDPTDDSARSAFYRRVAACPDTVFGEIFQYLRDAMIDRPAVRGSSAGPEYYSWAASLVSVVAGQFGWTDEYIINRPLKLLWQYAKCIRVAQNPKAVLFNSSDKAKAEWIMEATEETEDGKN